MNKADIVRKIQGIAGSYSVYNIFDDWVKMLALSISNTVDIYQQHQEQREKEYMETAGKYTGNQLEEFCRLNAMLVDVMQEKMDDVLGYVYMHLEISSSRLGQFFTPYHICQLMAHTNIQIQEKDHRIYKANEPSCGAGGNIIALAEYMKEQGIDYQDKLRVVCQDLDWRAVYMCYIQLSLYGIPAIVVQGDTLQDAYNGRVTETTFYTPIAILKSMI